MLGLRNVQKVAGTAVIAAGAAAVVKAVQREIQRDTALDAAASNTNGKPPTTVTAGGVGHALGHAPDASMMPW